MPFGRYTVFGDDGDPVGTEEFRCAPGPMGWRSFSQVQTSVPSPHRETLDFAVNTDWRIARVRIDTGEHDLLLEPNVTGDALTGYRDRRPIEIAYGPETHLDYFTPATNAITTRRLGITAEIDVVYLEPVTLEPSRVRQRYELVGDERVRTPVGAFDATRWRFTAIGSGWTADLWVAGDIVVRYERLFELEWLDPGASGPRPVER
ncbi:MAG: putative glycolipid-binding domain-containing protein [Actinomycetota bacterium]